MNKITKNNLAIILGLLLIAAFLSLFQIFDFDVQIQNYFFNFADKSWLIDSKEPIKKIIFYKFPKILLAVIIVCFLAASFCGFYKTNSRFYKNRHQILLIFLGLTLIPLIAGNIKKFTNIYCPNQLEIYGSSKPYVKIFDSYPANFVQQKKGQCFPAGHAITGFALFIFCFALKSKSRKFFAFLVAFIVGWILGFYQILKGAHFVSDTIIAMLICFVLAAIITRIYELY